MKIRIYGARLALIALLSSCATVAGRRENNDPITRVSNKSLAEFQTSFAKSQEVVFSQPNFLPKENGGTYTNGHKVSGVALYVLDVEQRGNKLWINLYAKGGIYGTREEIGRAIDNCI